MILSDKEIVDLGWHGGCIQTFCDEQVNPASYDMLLGDEFISFGVKPIPGAVNHPRSGVIIDPRKGIPKDLQTKHKCDEFILKPGGFILGVTDDWVGLPDNIVARIEGKSSLGRLGLAVHITAGYIDPGFKGHITLELANFSPHPIRLFAGMRIAQLQFSKMSQPARKPYDGKYQDAEGVQGSRVEDDYK